ncbi:MAG: RluA family pseudouridine synthase [Bdellovibrionia bacterium]
MDYFSKKPITWTWKASESSERSDLVLLKAIQNQEGNITNGELPTLTRNQLHRLMDDGLVTMNGLPLKANKRLLPGALVEIQFPPPLPTELVAEDRPLEILYEDEHLLVVNKPPGLTVHPSTTQMEGTLVHALLHHIRDLSGIGGVLRPGIVHRIDKNTSGALVITKNDLTHLRLSKIFSEHAIERAYWALCYGSPDVSTLRPTKIESLLGRSPTDRKKMSMTVKIGRPAISYFKKIEEFGHAAKKPFASWLEVTLETGRTHQVRVHLTGLGHSILGDPVYGHPSQTQPKWQALPENVKAAVLQLPGQALHARVLGFQHPITGEKLRFEAELPPGFRELLAALKPYG